MVALYTDMLYTGLKALCLPGMDLSPPLAQLSETLRSYWQHNFAGKITSHAWVLMFHPRSSIASASCALEMRLDLHGTVRAQTETTVSSSQALSS